MRQISGKRIWITGASYGIGYALARELHSRGARLGLTARSADKLEALCADLSGPTPPIALPGDVTDPHRMSEIVEEMTAQLGGIDILIANAGTHIFTNPLKFNADEYLSLMELNYGGTLRCIHAALPGMLERGGGHLVVVASLAGYRGLPSAGAYGATKAALINFVEGIRFQLQPKGVRVTVINPGFVRTPLTDKNKFKMPFLVEPDRAAKIMANGIARQRDEITFPIPFNWGIKLMRVLPFPLYKVIIARVWNRTPQG